MSTLENGSVVTQTRTSLAKRFAAAFSLVFALALSACGAEGQVLVGDTASETDSAASTETTGASTDPQDAEQGSSSIVTNAVEPTATPLPRLEIVTPVAQATAEPEPATTLSGPAVLASGGAAATSERVEFVVGKTLFLTGDVDSYIDDEVEPSDSASSSLLVEVSVESLAGVRWSVGTANFELHGPDGAVYLADDLYDWAANDVFSATIEGRDYVDLRVSFPITDRVEDVTGWNLVVLSGKTIPTVLPLSGAAYNAQYPLVLADGQQSTIDVGSYPGCGDGAQFETLIERAEVAIEGAAGFSSNYLRVPPNERLVSIDLALTGLADTSAIVGTSNCGLISAWPDFVLQVDGRPTQPIMSQRPVIDGIATLVLPLRFQIPASATAVELVGGAGTTSLGAWDIDLPAAVGEPAAELVPFDASVEVREQVVSGERPEELMDISLADGGATDTMLFVDYTVGATTATNATPESFVKGNPQIDGEGRTWIIAEVEAENTVDGIWNFTSNDFVLEDPFGRPYGGAQMFDRTGEIAYSVNFDGVHFEALRIAFETDGLVQDASGWNLMFHNGNDIPLSIPLTGSTPESEYPLVLETGEKALVGTDPFPTCADGGAIELKIEDAAVRIEGPNNFTRWGRTDPAHRKVVVDLELTNLVEGTNNCGLIAAWPAFLLDVDGRLTQPFLHTPPTIRTLETGDMTLSYEIPVETQEISLLAGSGRTVVANWDLKNPSEVLQDFGATDVRDNQTLITLDETLLFAFGESTLQQSATAPLNRVANVVNSESTGDIEIIGHTDAIGDDASNQRLSLARAEAVAAALEAAGVDPGRLVVSGEGEASPVAPNANDDGSDNPAGRQANRRVEIYFTAE